MKSSLLALFHIRIHLTRSVLVTTFFLSIFAAVSSADQKLVPGDTLEAHPDTVPVVPPEKNENDFLIFPRFANPFFNLDFDSAFKGLGAGFPDDVSSDVNI